MNEQEIANVIKIAESNLIVELAKKNVRTVDEEATYIYLLRKVRGFTK